MRDLVRELLADLVDRLEFSRMVIHDREFALPGFEVRESDMLARVPFIDDAEWGDIGLAILVEHQSTVDSKMPLRMLIYTVLYWIWELRHWDKSKRKRARWLTPVIPIIFYTGKRAWRKRLKLDDLIYVPPEVRMLCPQFAPILWALPEHTSEELWESKGAWIRALPVVREDAAGADRFQQVVAETARRLMPTAEIDPARWTHLLQFIWTWSLNRRAAPEADAIWAEIERMHEAGSLKEKVQAMGKTAAETLIERGLEQGLERGLERGRMQTLREILTRRLAKRFGEVPRALAKRIANEVDADALDRALESVDDAKSPRDIKF